MIQNADFVEKCLKNTNFGKKAQQGFDCTLKSLNAISLEGGGRILKNQTQLAERKLVTPIVAFKSSLETFKLCPGVYAVEFNEGGKIPPGYCAWFFHRSSLARNGAFIYSGLYDSGFECETFGCLLHITIPIEIEKNARIAQLILAKAETSELYQGQWQGKKDVK